MQTVTVEIQEQKFTFKVEETILDKIKIDNEASSLIGGRTQLSELQSTIDITIKKLHELNELKYGKDAYRVMRERFAELNPDENKEEYDRLWREINDNTYFLSYVRLQSQLDDVYGYARIKVLCSEKPKDVDFYSQNEKFMRELLNTLEEQKVFFRKSAN